MTVRCSGAALWIAVGLVLSLSGCSDATSPDPVWAQVDGQAIRRSDVLSEIALDVYRLRVDLHRKYLSETRRQVDRLLVEKAASSSNQTADAWLAEQSEELREAPTDSDIQEYLDARGLGPDRRPQVAHYLEERSRLEAELQVMDGLRKAAGVHISIEPPERPTIVLKIAPKEAQGLAGAPLTVVTYGSLQDPRARRLAEAALQVQKDRPEDLRYAHRSIPTAGDEVGLRLALWSLRAESLGVKPRWVNAVLAAGRLDSVADVDALAAEFELGTPAPLGVLKQAIDAARRLGVSDRAAVFVNGTYIDASFGPRRLREHIRKTLGDL